MILTSHVKQSSVYQFTKVSISVAQNEMGKEIRHGTDFINCVAIRKEEYSTNIR